MKAADLQEVNERMETVRDLTDAAAKQYPLKALAYDLKPAQTKAKAESTLRGELNGQPGYKLGAETQAQIWYLTGDLSPLHELNSIFGLTALELPAVNGTDPVPVMAKAGRLSKEFSDVIDTTAQALADGRLEPPEIKDLSKEVEDLLIVCVHFNALLKHMLEQTARPPRRDK